MVNPMSKQGHIRGIKYFNQALKISLAWFWELCSYKIFLSLQSDGEESDDIGDHNELESNPKTERIEEKNNFQEMKNNTCSFINK